MKKSLYVLLLSICLLSGCAPRVVSDMYTYEFAPVSADSVRLFQPDEAVPAQSLAIGKVTVVDNSLSAKGNYLRFLKLAIGETAKYGGNGLILEQLPESGIHRLWGTMIRMEETAADTVVRRSVEQVLERSGHEGYQEYNNSLRQYTSLREEQPSNSLSLAIGPSFMASRYQVGTTEFKSKWGLGVTADYEHVWKSGFGLGLNYLYDFKSYEYMNSDIKLRLNYIGPCAAFEYLVSENWRWGVGIGLGCGWFSEKYWAESNTESHLATLIRLKTEFKVSNSFGVGLQMNVFTMRMKKPDDFVLKDNEFYGIRNLGFLLSFHYYF